MTEAEKKSFFAHASSRAPGKRQIKPTAAVLDLVLPADDDEEDDEDFIADVAGGASGAESGEGSGSSSSESDDDEEEDDDKDNIKTENDDEYQGGNDAEHKGDTNLPPICALCLNLRTAVAQSEIMQCDRCGLNVHESCYLPDIADDAASTSSSNSTEPWFCEPCTFGLIEPPHCELCPDRHGAMKRSDIGGGWVHILCALYTPGVTFGDIDHLGAISWQEMDHRNFGRKSCAGCTDKLEARTGVATRCELGLCKYYYHTTCAQRLGLLVDHSDAVDDNFEDAQSVQPRYINCKKHSNPDAVRDKRTAYSRWFYQEEKRMLMIRRRTLSASEERQRIRARQRREKCHNALVGVTICWPDANFDQPQRIRRSRQLHTSARFLEAFREKAELVDVDKDQFEQEFVRVDGASLPFLNPGFSQQFVEYFENREKNVFTAEQKRLEELKRVNEGMKKKQETMLIKYKKLEESQTETHRQCLSISETVREMHDALIALGITKIKLPDALAHAQSPSRRNSLAHKPNATKRAALHGSVEKIVLQICAQCHKQSDQHLLIKCDACKHHFHLACLDPPLEKMPKKINYEFFCSNCCDSGDEDDIVPLDESVEDEDSRDGPLKSRRLRQRNDHVKAQRLRESEEQARAYKAAISGSLQRGGVKKTSTARKSEKRKTIDDPEDSARTVRSPLSKRQANGRCSTGSAGLRSGRSSGLSHYEAHEEDEADDNIIVYDQDDQEDEL